MDEKRRSIALRVPPKFRQFYDKLSDTLRRNDGQESRRVFTDALMITFLQQKPQSFLACDTRAAQVRSLICEDLCVMVTEYVETTRHHVPFSVFSYNAIMAYCTDPMFRDLVDECYRALISGTLNIRTLVAETRNNTHRNTLFPPPESHILL